MSRCSIREHVTINLGTAHGGSFTKIADDCLLMSGVHVAHDCSVGKAAILSSGAGIAGESKKTKNDQKIALKTYLVPDQDT